MPERCRISVRSSRLRAVQTVIETGKPITEVTRDLGVNHGTLGNWMKAWRYANPEPAAAIAPVKRARANEMEAEIRRLRMENQLLKKQRTSSPGRPSS